MRRNVEDMINTISAFALLVMLVVGAVTIAGQALIAKSPTFMVGEEHAYREVAVQPGDTLWSIAKSQVPNEDPRDVVGLMRELNQLDSADIFPGQVLTVRVTQPIQPYKLAER
ncbi:MAG: LysM peptidoglycan-binding domain-containing protein [Bacillota bacterium]|jgi:LysM repeat protein|nr:LysM peptidoglycan-binding domain-containing protein [Bacillota bacterium]HHT91052.1 LysM peptidoglycan-binding domain-containing protein [Bacillota bacterium]